MATDASTSNFIVLSTGVISKTGTCARVADGNMASIKTRRIVNLIEASLGVRDLRKKRAKKRLTTRPLVEKDSESRAFDVRNLPPSSTCRISRPVRLRTVKSNSSP
jgi:hypothetical protein